MAMDINEEIKKAVEELENLNLSEEESIWYDSKERGLRDFISNMDYAEKKGIAKGKEEGIKEGKLEIAKKMLKKGIEIEEIIELTGLTKEEIKKV